VGTDSICVEFGLILRSGHGYLLLMSGLPREARAHPDARREGRITSGSYLGLPGLVIGVDGGVLAALVVMEGAGPRQGATRRAHISHVASLVHEKPDESVSRSSAKTVLGTASVPFNTGGLPGTV
jgi:hypothetical protein